MLKEINTVFDGFKTFEESPVMADLTSTERIWLIDAFLKMIPPWQLMEFYEASGATEDLEHGIKAYTLGNPDAMALLDTARYTMRHANFIERDIDDLIYDAYCKREVGYSI
ncbi:MAG: hypothetical protein WBC22_00790 [Sedimentisphaerales bacterium]